ncbi:MAG: NRDE family protein [Gammaproteobacteria bacterium]|nr:NRDE family protein [Gammaproteobacteria bacterium]
MCLVAIAVNPNPDYALIVAGNRDEFHERPSAAAHWWPDRPDILGGVDLLAGGSWLAVRRDGQFAVVTNQPHKAAPANDSPSRGDLVRQFLSTTEHVDEFAGRLLVARDKYAGFCLAFGSRLGTRIVCEPEHVHINGGDADGEILIITNAPANQSWPKAAFLEFSLRELLDGNDCNPADLLAPLDRRDAIASRADGVPAVAVAPFVVGDTYGTRASTVFTVSTSGHCTFIERRHGAGGAPAGESRFDFAIAD